MNPIQLSVSFLNLFIISFPLSVTLSQTFAILSIFFFLFGSFQSKNLLSILRNQTFVAAIAIYIALLPSFFLHLFDYQVSIFTVPFKSELSDFWMCLLILPAFYHIRQSEYRISILVIWPLCCTMEMSWYFPEASTSTIFRVTSWLCRISMI